MIDILPELVVGNEPLEQFRVRLQASIDSNLESDRRLRTAYEAMIMLETAEATLRRIDTEGFVEKFKQKIEETRQNAARMLAEEASALRTRLETVEAEATALRDEVQTRGRCINDVREEITTYLPTDGTVEELRVTADTALTRLERIIKGAVDTRQGRSFAELEELAANTGGAFHPSQPNSQSSDAPDEINSK